MTTTLSTTLTDVRARLDETTARFWTDAQLTTWINEAMRDMARRSETLQNFHTSTAVLPNVNKYPLPSDVIRVHRIEFVPLGTSNQSYVLQASNYQQMDAMWGTNQSMASTYPTYYVIWGYPPTLTLQLYPSPSQAGTLNIFYYRLPKTVSASTDVLEIPEGWQDMVSLYCEYVAKRKDKDATWQEAKQLYEEKMQQLLDRTREWHDQADVVYSGFRPVPQWLYNFEDF